MKIVFVGAAIWDQAGEQAVLVAGDDLAANEIEKAGGVAIRAYALPKGQRRVVARLIADANQSRQPKPKAKQKKSAT